MEAELGEWGQEGSSTNSLETQVSSFCFYLHLQVIASVLKDIKRLLKLRHHICHPSSEKAERRKEEGSIDSSKHSSWMSHPTFHLTSCWSELVTTLHLAIRSLGIIVLFGHIPSLNKSRAVLQRRGD